MTNYNSPIKYNQPLVTYNGVVLVIEQEIVVNSSTISVLEIINVPIFGNSELEMIEQAAAAATSVLNDPNADGYTVVSIDKENSHAVVTFDSSLDKSADASFTVTIISNI